VQSRRGYIGGRRKQNSQAVRSTAHVTNDTLTPDDSYDGLLFSNQQSPAGTDQTTSSDSTITLPCSIAPEASGDHLVDVYYDYIHPAHPFVIPRKLYMQNPNFVPEYLKRAMRFIASNISGWCEDGVGGIADIINIYMPTDGFKVQTNLILTIAAYARCERGQGDLTLLQAINTAQQIGMHLEGFGHTDSPIVQESWRRTWWELYSIASMIRVLTPTTTALDATLDRILPSNDTDYSECHVTESRTLDDMQDRLFTEDNTPYSSFAYRIEAVRILNTVVEATQQTSPHPDQTSNSLSASIKSYLLSVPTPNPNTSTDSNPDELMSCAQMTINFASILLHLPRSTLTTSPLQTICATDRSKSTSTSTPLPSPTETQTNTTSALTAADAITNLLISRTARTLRTLSPCFSCAIAFAVTVQLSAYRVGQRADRARCLKEYIQLSLSALDNIGQNWAVAKAVKRQLAEFAREILRRPRTKSARRQIGIVPVQETGGLQMPVSLPLGLEGPAVVDLEDDFWLRSFVDDPLVYSFMGPSQGQS